MKKLLFNVACSGAFVFLTNRFLESKEPLKFVSYCAAFVAAIISLLLIFYYFRHFVPLRSRGKGFYYVYVESDSNVRELIADEQEYLCMEFSPGDGGRPAIKTRYDEKNGWGNVEGFIPRNRVPRRVTISTAVLSSRSSTEFHY